MAQRLAALAAAADQQDSIFLSATRLAKVEAALADAPKARRRPLELARATQLLNLGRTSDAIEALERLHAQAPPLEKRNAGVQRMCDEVESLLAIAWLRLGEEENCLARHGPESCIAPFSEAARHVETRGAQRASELYAAILARDPERLDARWLLNLCAMALGTWPDGVEERFRIPREAFASQAPLPRFTDVTAQVGLQAEGLSGGAVADDFDGDGWIDVVASSWGLRDPMRAWRNKGDGTFEEVTEAAGLAGLTGGLNLASGDFDNDGRVDLVVPRGGWMREVGELPNSLLLNRGGFRFDDVSFAAGLTTEAPTQVVVAADFDLDGWLDLFVGNESGEKGYPCELWWNQRDGTFRDVAAEAGVGFELFVKGATATDIEGDGRPDLFLSVMGRENVLLRNVARDTGAPPLRFVDVSARARIEGPRRSFPCASFDFDHDGDDDLLCASYVDLSERHVDDIARVLLDREPESEGSALYLNQGDGTYREVGEQVGLRDVILTMSLNFGDLDGDGWLDFLFGNGDPDFRTLLPNRALKNDAGRRFLDVTTAGGFGHLQKGHGIAFADFDDDGDQDVYQVLGGANPGDVFRRVLLENPGSGARWLALELAGRRSNRAAIGTKIVVRVATPAGPRAFHHTCSTGGSFGASSLRQELGLGDATAIESVELFWPASGLRQTLRGLELDRRYRVVEGAAAAEPLPMVRARFTRG